MTPDSTILLYSRPDCPLCDEGQEKVELIAARLGLTVRKIDIETDAELLEAHRYRIPVAIFRGEELGWGRLSRKGIERRLRRLLDG